MLKHNPKLKKLCTKDGKIDKRKMRSKAFMEELSKIALKDLGSCPHCGAPLIPDKEAVRFGTKEWDGHSYKWDCECCSKDLRVSIG